MIQEYAKNLIVKELKDKIGTELGIGKLHFQLFNTIQLDSVYLYDQSNTKVLMADKLSASVDMFALSHGKIIFTSAGLSDFEIRLSKETSDSPLNIQYIIDAFKSKDDKPKSPLDIKLNSINISGGQFYFDIKDKPVKQNVFDANHIYISDFDSKLSIKSVVNDSLNIHLKKLNFKEKSGLEVSNLVFKLITQDKKASIRGFRLEMPSSQLRLSKCEIDMTPSSDTAKLIDYIKIDCALAPSFISPKDIAALSPALQHFKDKITLQAEIAGSVNSLDVNNLSLSYGEKTHFISNIEVKDIKEKEKMYILGTIDKLEVHNKDLENILNNLSKNKTNFPPLLKNIGDISFEGDISGYLNQLTAFGSLETASGIVNTDVLFSLKPRLGIDYNIQGKIYATKFDLGGLLNNKSLGKTSLNVAVHLQKPTHGKIKGALEGDISEFDFKEHTYNDITLDVAYDGLRIDGVLNIDDTNGSLALNGLFDLSDSENPVLNFYAKGKNIQLDKLNVAKQMEHSYLSFVMDANFTGKDIDGAEGIIKIDSIDFIRDDKVFMMDEFKLELSSHNEGERRLGITSDLINGEIKGIYSFSSFISSMQETLHPYLPAIIKEPKKKPLDKTNILAFNFQINNTENISAIFRLPVIIYSPAKIIGSYNNIQNKFNLEAYTPSIKAAGMNIKSGYIQVANPSDSIEANIKALVIGKKEAINDISIDVGINDNLVNTHISLINTGAQRARGNFSISTLFTKEQNEPIQIDIDMLPSELLINNAMWKMNKSHIRIKDNTFAVNNFLVSNENGNQEVSINGKYSNKNSTDILKAELTNIDLEYIFETLAIDALQFGGAATGKAFVSSVEGKPYANTSLEVIDFKFNKTKLGKLDIFSELDEETNKVILDGSILSEEKKRTKVDGTLDPIAQKLSINFDADSIDIGFLNKYSQSVFQNVGGRGSGNVHLFGDFSNVTVEGRAYIENGHIGIKFLNTDYTFSDSVFMKKDLIYFNDIILKDQHNNKALASGKVSHDFFRDFMYHVDLSADNFLVYNATQYQNPIFWGKVFGSGNGSIGGDEKAVDVNIRMRTEENTLVRMNFMDDIVNEYNFINYKSPNDIDSLGQTASVMQAPIKTDSDMAINMNFYIDATPDAVVELVMDPVGGDILRGMGTGAMQFEWSTKSSPRLYGTYNINRGSYNFTFQRLMERRFLIEDGSNVQFRGDPFEADLRVKAIYKITASLSDLDKKLTEQTGLTTIPVNCVLNLTGPLKHPNVGLDIDFPSSDPEVERQLKSVINTEDMVYRQVTFLLLLSKFYTPPENIDGKTSDFAAVASATLSNQLTKIVSQIDNRWQLGTNIRYDNSANATTNTEMELLLSSRLLNDRLLINGNIGYRDDVLAEKEAFIGDIDIEYLLNNAGTWRVKAYNHYNEKYYYTGRSTQTQGIGLIYKKDFDGLQDLFKRPSLKAIRRDSIYPIIPDSATKGSPLSDFVRLKK